MISPPCTGKRPTAQVPPSGCHPDRPRPMRMHHTGDIFLRFCFPFPWCMRVSKGECGPMWTSPSLRVFPRGPHSPRGHRCTPGTRRVFLLVCMPFRVSSGVHLPVVLVKWLAMAPNRSQVPERAGSVKVFTVLFPRDIPGVRGTPCPGCFTRQATE